MNRKPFQLLQKGQKLAGELTNACAIADKNYRLTICQDIRHYSYDLVHCIRRANSSVLGSNDRILVQEEAVEYLERINDLMPILRMCRCITNAQEAQIEKRIGEIRYSLDR